MRRIIENCPEFQFNRGQLCNKYPSAMPPTISRYPSAGWLALFVLALSRAMKLMAMSLLMPRRLLIGKQHSLRRLASHIWK